MIESLDERAAWLGRNILPHEPALRSWLQARRVADLDPEDIIQEAYTRLISTEDVGRIRDHRSYLFQVAKSVIYTHLRRAKVVPMSSVADLDVLAGGADEPSPEDVAIDRDELRRVAHAIATLPDRPRTVFKMRRVDGKSQKEIAAALGINEGAVERLMGEALFALRSMLGRRGSTRSGASMRKTRAKRGNHAAGERRGD